MIRPPLFSILAAALLLSAQAQQQAVAGGFGDFSAPPPKAVPKPKPKPRPAPHRHKPVHRPRPVPVAPPSETQEWISGPRLCQGRGQLCSESATWPLQTELSGDFFLQTRVPSKYCSPFTMSISLDDELLGSTRLSEPGQVGVYKLGNLGPGGHLIEIWAIGSTGGCNVGRLETWGVDLVLSSDPSYRANALDLSTGR